MEQPRRASEVCRSSIARARHNPYCHTTTISSRRYLAPSTGEDCIGGAEISGCWGTRSVAGLHLSHPGSPGFMHGVQARNVTEILFFLIAPPRLSKSARCPNLLDSRTAGAGSRAAPAGLGRKRRYDKRSTRDHSHDKVKIGRVIYESIREWCIRGEFRHHPSQHGVRAAASPSANGKFDERRDSSRDEAEADVVECVDFDGASQMQSGTKEDWSAERRVDARRPQSGAVEEARRALL